MINEIYPHRINLTYIPEIGQSDADVLLYFNDGELLLKRDGSSLVFPTRKEMGYDKETGFFLFNLNGINCFLIGDCPFPENGEFGFHDINFFRKTHQKEVAWASLLGLHLMNWYTQNRFCGKCGSPNKAKDDERAMVCTACDNIVYPKISPAVIVAVVSGNNKILLALGNKFRSNFYSLVAGYADVGESLEEAVAREVKEEVGLSVRNIRYYKSQPWPLSGSVMIGYIADADDSQPVIPDKNEITEAAWFTRGNIPNHPPLLSIAGEMIEKFISGELV